MASQRNCAVCSIIPPYILQRLAENVDPKISKAAKTTLLTSARLRGERAVLSQRGISLAALGDGRRTILDCAHSYNLSDATVARGENDGPTGDDSVNEAWDGFGKTRE